MSRDSTAAHFTSRETNDRQEARKCERDKHGTIYIFTTTVILVFRHKLSVHINTVWHIPTLILLDKPYVGATLNSITAPLHPHTNSSSLVSVFIWLASTDEASGFIHTPQFARVYTVSYKISVCSINSVVFIMQVACIRFWDTLQVSKHISAV